MGRKAIDSNELFMTNWKIPKEDLIGEEGRGFEYILHGMNPERVMLAAEAVGIGTLALQTATAYAKERIVFNRPIGQNQAVQHPLARCWMELEAAWLMTLSAANRYDKGLECGAAANAAKYLAAEAGYKSCETAVMTHGGFGYSSRVSRRALLARSDDPSDRTDQSTAHLVLHRRASTGIAEVILTRASHLQPLQHAVAREVRAWRFSQDPLAAIRVPHAPAGAL